MSRTTTAFVVSEPNGPFELKEIHLDEIRPDEALVEIHASGICHTDLSVADGTLPGVMPAVLGHEGAGVVLETGAEITNVSKGDNVLLSFSFCGSCAPCTAGYPSNCHGFNQRNFGGKRPDGTSMATIKTNEGTKPLHSSFFGQSSFARHTLVQKSSLVKVPPGTDLPLFAALGCGIQTGAGAILRTLDVRPGSTVAIFGVGSVGLSAVMAAAKVRGAGTVIAIDRQPGRLEVAKKLGATHSICVQPETDVAQEIRRICPPVGVDYAVDGTGVPKVVGTMIDSLGAKGKAATVGAPGPGITAEVEILAHITHGRSYMGCCEGDSIPAEFIPYLMECHAKGQLPLEDIITYYPSSEYKKAFKESKDGTAIKAVLKYQ